jgi:chemotaxis protein methyltransferase CheR
MNESEKEELELDAFLSIVNQCYGYNFSEYARSSIRRRIRNLASTTGHKYISEMLPKLLYDNDFIDKFLKGMSVTVTEMFRDPWAFKVLRETVIPTLKIFPKINIWHAGCATGEEVYSMAILLKEEGLLDYAQIYATDYNNHSLKIAQEGIYPLENMQTYTQNYIKSGGKKSFSDYYHVKYNSAKFDSSLKKNIVFTNHNLVEDKAFGEMNLVVCRNVLIYFKQTLQDKVLTLFRDSLLPRGFLLLGDKETINFSRVSENFEKFSAKEKIFRMK